MSALPHMTPILNYSQVHTYKGCRSKPMLRFPQKDCTRAKYSLRVFIIPIITLVCLTFQTLLNEGQLWQSIIMKWPEVTSNTQGLAYIFFQGFYSTDALMQGASEQTDDKAKLNKKKGKKRTFSFGKSPSGQTTERNVMVMLKLRGSTLKNISL